MILAQVFLHFLEHLPLELRTARAPASLQRFPFGILRFRASPPFHSFLKLLPPSRTVLTNSMSAEQSFGSNPSRTVFPRSQIPVQAAPGIGEQAILAPE